MATDTLVPETEVTFLHIAPAAMEPWPGLNPRKHFDEAKIEELELSIRAKGVLEPLAVHDRGDDLPDGEVRYWIVAGERRWRAGSRVGAALPCVVRYYTLAEALEIALIENIQRASLNPIEEARGFQARLDEGDITEAELAEKLGLSQPYVNNRRRLLDLPEPVQELIASGLVKPSYARDMLLPWLREEPEISERFFRVLVQHLQFQAGVNEPFTKAFLAQTIAALSKAVKPQTSQPAAAEASAAATRPPAQPKSEPARATAAAPAPEIPETPAPAPAAEPTPPATDATAEPQQADPPSPSILSGRPTVDELETQHAEAGAAEPAATPAAEAGPASDPAPKAECRCVVCGCTETRVCMVDDPQIGKRACAWEILDSEAGYGLCDSPACVAVAEKLRRLEEGSAAEAEPAGLVAALEPILDRHIVAITVQRQRAGGPVTLMIAPREKKGGASITPRVVTHPAEEMDAALVKAAKSVVAELTNADN